MWNDDLCMLVMSTVQYQLLPNINSADHIVYHHEDLYSIPKYRIQLNQLLEFKLNQIILPSSNFSGSEKNYMGSETLTLSDYVTKMVLQNPKREPKNPNKRKGFNKLCEKYIHCKFVLFFNLTKRNLTTKTNRFFHCIQKKKPIVYRRRFRW